MNIWMRRMILAGSLAMQLGMATTAAATPAINTTVLDAAARWIIDVQWRENSVLTAEFSCFGLQQHAILGTTGDEIVVAMFDGGLKQAPELLRFAAEGRQAATATISLETIDAEMVKAAGAPPGMRPSASCRGLRLSDGGDDAAHIYWDHQAEHFDSW